MTRLRFSGIKIPLSQSPFKCRPADQKALWVRGWGRAASWSRLLPFSSSELLRAKLRITPAHARSLVNHRRESFAWNQLKAGMVSSVIFCLMLFVSLSYGTEYSETVALHNRYKAHWKFDNETAMFYFKVEVKATGWIAFGVSRLLFPPSTSLQWNRHSMEKYDIIVGGISNGTAYYKVSVIQVLRFTVTSHQSIRHPSYRPLKKLHRLSKKLDRPPKRLDRPHMKCNTK